MMRFIRHFSLSGLFFCSSILTVNAQTAFSDTVHYLEVNDARFFVRRVGSGMPLIILHGGPGMSHDYLAPQLVDLLADQYQLIFYDQRASGRSSGAEDTSRLTMNQFVSDLESIRKALTLDRINLIGHSFGGLLALYYATAYPHALEKLLLLDTSPASWELNFPYFQQAIANRQSEADKQTLLTLQKTADIGRQPEAMEQYLKVFFRAFFHDPRLSENIHLGINDQWLANYAVTGSHIWKDLGRYDIHETLNTIPAPTLIIHGSESVISVDGAKAIANRIPQARLMVLDDVGHFPYIEAPELVGAGIKAFFR